MRALFAILLLLCAACDKKADTQKAETKKVETVAKFTGTASVRGKPAKLTSCEAVDISGHAAAKLKLDTGAVVVVDPAEGTTLDGAKLACTKHVVDGPDSALPQPWFVYTMSLVCTGLVLDAQLDCGTVYRPSNLMK